MKKIVLIPLLQLLFVVAGYAQITVSPTNASGCAQADGKATVTVNNAAAGFDFEYSLDAVAYQASNTFDKLKPGNYKANVRDKNTQCVFSKDFMIGFGNTDKDCDGDPDSTDCNSNDPSIHHGATEIPGDGIDQDCDGIDAQTWYRDWDGDGFGDPNRTKIANTQPSGYVANKLDCDDYNTYYQDKDGDGHGSLVKVPCPGSLSHDDCDDNNVSVHFQYAFFRDGDGDGYGDKNQKIMLCTLVPPSGYVRNATDCDDSDPKVYWPKSYWRDADGDGFGDPGNKILVCTSTPPSGYVSVPGDCNDNLVLYFDSDHDGYGGPILMACNGVSNNLDPDDHNPKVPVTHPSTANRNGQPQAWVVIGADQFALAAYPNTFAKTTRIQYAVPLEARVTIKLYDVLGREVGTIFSGQRTVGTYTTDYSTRKLSSGVYYAKLVATAGGKMYSQTQKLIKTD